MLYCPRKDEINPKGYLPYSLLYSTFKYYLHRNYIFDWNFKIKDIKALSLLELAFSQNLFPFTNITKWRQFMRSYFFNVRKGIGSNSFFPNTLCLSIHINVLHEPKFPRIEVLYSFPVELRNCLILKRNWCRLLLWKRFKILDWDRERRRRWVSSTPSFPHPGTS